MKTAWNLIYIVLGYTFLIKFILRASGVLPKGSPHVWWLYTAAAAVVLGALMLPKVIAARSGGKPMLYTEEEMCAVQQHIESCLGKSEYVLHELISPDIHVDIIVIPPTDTRPYCTLCTLGMGEHRMRIPRDLRGITPARCELCITLPPHWRLDKESLEQEEWYWPLRWLKQVARYPLYCHTWLTFAHTIADEDGGGLAPGVSFNSFILDRLPDELPSADTTLPGGEPFTIYRLHPLYPEELQFALQHGSLLLLQTLHEQLPPLAPVDPHRPTLRLTPPPHDSSL